MRKTTRRASGAAVAGAALAAAAVFAASGAATGPDGPSLAPVPFANTKAPGYSPAGALSAELRQVVVAQGSTKLENPSGPVTYYGYLSDVTSGGEPQMLPTPTSPTEAQKTEPDKNVYLVFKQGLPGPDATYDYGTHFLFQGHEAGAPGSITRINLDGDAKHRVTLLATSDRNGTPLPTFDGITWEPWAKRLLLTSERAANGGVWAADLSVPASVEDVSGAFGRGGYEGIQNDSAGEIWIVEDVGGANKPGTTARIPNSFLYRFVPSSRGTLTSGKLEALQVLNDAGDPITQASQTPVNAPDQLALHTFGKSFRTRWLTIHDTATAGNAPFDANAAAKAANATPFKRPENGQFRPGSHFSEFFFDETGDTNAGSVENDTAGGWGSIFKLTQEDPTASTGRLTIFYKGNAQHAGFDNVAFLSRNAVSFVEDAGDGLHTARNALDSGFVWNVTTDYSNPANQPVRWLAQGRDPSATIDAANGGFGKNDQDNEITGIHVSNGDPAADGILGAKQPQLFENPAWRWFYTQQHGDNVTYEVVAAGRGGD